MAVTYLVWERAFETMEDAERFADRLAMERTNMPIYVKSSNDNGETWRAESMVLESELGRITMRRGKAPVSMPF